MRVWTIGHGTRTADELVATLHEAGVETLVDVRRFPGSRRNPQLGQAALAGIELAYPSYAAILGAAARQLVPNIGYAAMRHTPQLQGDDGAD